MVRFASVRGQIRRRKFRPALELMEVRLTPSTLVVDVTNHTDTNVFDANSTSLRAAISVCNGSSPTFDGRVVEIKSPGVYNLTLNGSDEDNNATGDLDILQSLTIINDTNGGSVTIQANGLTSPDRVFDVGPNGEALSVTLKGVTIQNGSAPAGGAIRVPSPSDLTLDSDVVQDNTAAGGGGGAVFMLDGDLTLTGTTIRDNKTSGSGGGVLQSGNGALTINSSLITGNQSQGTAGQGGGVRYDGTGDVKIIASQFTNNTAVGNGGGFLNTNDAALTISASTFNNNRSNGLGGGLFLATGVASSLTNVTISNNVAQGNGGGLYDAGNNGGLITLQNDTIAFNSAQSAGGLFDGEASMRLINTIIAQNLSGVNRNPDVDGVLLNRIVDVGNNFIGNNFGVDGFLIAGAPNTHGSFIGSSAAPLDPLLGPLTDNGSLGQVSTLTHANLPNRGNNGVRDRGLDAGAPSTDERGQPRVSGAHTDIGAFEFQNPDEAVSASGPTGTIRAGAPLSLSFVVTNNGPNTSSAVVLGVTLPANTTVVSASVGFTVSGNVVNLAVPDLAKSANATITLTVTPNAPGPFTATATLGVDPDLSNNSAAVNLTLLPAPFPATGSADVTTLVQVKLLSPRKRAKRETFRITNTSTKAIQGPLGVFPVITSGIKLKNASGQAAKKQKFVRLNFGGDNLLDPGETTTIQLVFSKAFLPRRFKVLAGAFA
jgi:uncharacterized repeat protein (TIGR01451 family)